MSIISINPSYKRKVQEQSQPINNTPDPLQGQVSEVANKRISPHWQASGNGDFSRFVITPTGNIQRTMVSDRTALAPLKSQISTNEKYSSLQEALLIAKTLYVERKFQDVIEVLENTPIPLKSQSARNLKSQFHEIKGDSLKKLGELRSAISNYINAVDFEKDPQRKAELFHKIAESYLENQDPESASRAINYALKNHNFDDVQKNRLFKLQERLRASDAPTSPTEGPKEENLFKPSASTSDLAANLAKVHLQHGLSHIDSDQLDEAIKSFQYGLRAIDLAFNPEIYRELCFYLGTAYFKQNNFKDCIEVWQLCLKQSTDIQFKGNLIQLLASAHVANKESEKGTKMLEVAIEQNLPSDEKGMLILCLSDIWLQGKGKELKISHLLFPLLIENSISSDEIKLQFCNKLMRLARETNSSELYEKVKLIGMSSTKTEIDTKANFLIESAMIMEAQNNYSAAIEVYQFLLIQKISNELLKDIIVKIARINRTLSNPSQPPVTSGFY